MTDDNVVSFPGTDKKKTKGKKKRDDTADKILQAAMGRYEDVVVIGINKGGGQCISSIPLILAVYELSRAIHRIHEYADLEE